MYVIWKNSDFNILKDQLYLFIIGGFKPKCQLTGVSLSLSTLPVYYNLII